MSPGTVMTRPASRNAAHSSGLRRVSMTKVPPRGTPSAKSTLRAAPSSIRSEMAGRVTSHASRIGLRLTRPGYLPQRSRFPPQDGVTRSVMTFCSQGSKEAPLFMAGQAVRWRGASSPRCHRTRPG